MGSTYECILKIEMSDGSVYDGKENITTKTSRELESFDVFDKLMDKKYVYAYDEINDKILKDIAIFTRHIKCMRLIKSTKLESEVKNGK